MKAYESLNPRRSGTREPIFWPCPYPKEAYRDNRSVLIPYSKSARRAIAHPEDGSRRRALGYKFGPGSLRDQGGAIPPSLIVAAPSPSDLYRRAERARGRVAHPASMPDPVAEPCEYTTFEAGHGADPIAGEGENVKAGPMADAGRRAQIGPQRRLTVGSRRHEIEPPACAEDAIAEASPVGAPGRRVPVRLIAELHAMTRLYLKSKLGG
jgi:hypothetical protein